MAWYLRIAENSYFGCVCYFLDTWCMKKAEYMRCISAQLYLREELWQDSAQWADRKERKIEDFPLCQRRSCDLRNRFLAVVRKISQLLLADFVVFTDSFGNSLEFCWVCEKEQGLSSPQWFTTGVAGGGVHLPSLGYSLHHKLWNFATICQWFMVLIILMPLTCFRDYLHS